MKNTFERESKQTVILEHVLPHETIRDLSQRVHLEGTRFRVTLTVETELEPESSNKWSTLLEGFKKHSLSPEALKEFDEARQEFRENFIMRDLK